MPTIFLHGGGDHPASRAETFGHFVRTMRAHHAGPLALIVAEAVEADRAASARAYRAIFEAAGVEPDMVLPLFVTPAQPLSYAALAKAQPAGVFVCGGATPF